jgi:Serine aminopeptidase, S33
MFTLPKALLLCTLSSLPLGRCNSVSSSIEDSSFRDEVADHRDLSFDPKRINVDQDKYLADQTYLTDGSVDWEWVLIRINRVSGLENADWFGEAYPEISAQAAGYTSVDPPILEFSGDKTVSQYVFPVISDHPGEFKSIGMVAYPAGTASRIEFVLKDLDGYTGFFDDLLLAQAVDLNTTLPESIWDQWVDVLLTEGDYHIDLSLWRSKTPVITSQQQEDMGLTEVLMNMEDGSVASLVYKTDPSFEKAVLYFPGRSDSFVHPHVLEMYKELGYDLYSIDARYCGRARRFMNDTLFGHYIDDFDTYDEEVEKTLAFMKEQKKYTKIVAHAHSTGALVALNYAMNVKNEPFDAYILNGPFLDWGHVGGPFYEFLLEHPVRYLATIECCSLVEPPLTFSFPHVQMLLLLNFDIRKSWKCSA